MLFLFRWERAVWSAIEIVSSVGVVWELEWVLGVWDDGVDVSHDQTGSGKGYLSIRCTILYAVVELAI